MTMPLVAVWNCSSLVTDAELVPVVSALQKQVSRDFAPHWDLDAALVAVPGSQTPPAGSWIVSLRDTTEVSDALGYHEDQGTPSGLVGIKTCIDDSVPWSSCLSHEVLELLVDPWATLAAESTGAVYSLEVCDPVESTLYAIDGVSVSDFVLPSFFMLGTPSPWDFLGILTAPFQLAQGGYMMSATVGGWTQQNAEGVRESKAIPLPGSRRHKRFNRAAG